MNNSISGNEGDAPEQIAAWIGLDWADREHSIALYDVRTGETESYTLKHTAEALQEWIAGLRARYGGAKVAVVLEQSRGSVLYGLMNCDFIVLYPVNPKSLARYREALFTSGAKSDPGDAELLRDMVRKHPERFRPWVAEDVDTRSLRLLVEDRRKLVDQMTRLTNQLKAELKNYYPQALEWVGELNSYQACDFLEKWPTLEAVQSVRAARLSKFYRNYGRPRLDTINRRLEEIKRAVPLTTDRAVVLAGSLKVQALVAQIRPLIAIIEQYDYQIKQLFQKHPDRPLFESLRGAGAVLAPRLVAAFGVDRDRWESAADIQRLSGIAPVTERSGKQKWVHHRWACPKFLKQTFHEYAEQSVIWCDWANVLYKQQRKAGKGRQAAIRAVAYKWIRILFRCWKNRVAYDDRLYLEVLEKRGSELSAGVKELRQSKPVKPKAA